MLRKMRVDPIHIFGIEGVHTLCMGNQVLRNQIMTLMDSVGGNRLF